MSFDFLKPDVWDGLVLGTILIGLSLAILRLLQDWAAYRLRQELQRRNAAKAAGKTSQRSDSHD